ncbi:tetratricopeptide repeat protein [Actinoplanes sp. CA-142083]|uniref:tetratricopeptide repeat protein n=1 Tax=Actinoplanes sp. CA-142083 TaxID=3239903 RepID=UPI003D93CE02
MASALPPRHAHANVPIASAADLSLTDSPVVEGAWHPPFDRLPMVVRGRADMVDGLRRHVGGVVVLTGQAGCGKTTVALAAAHQLAGDHRVFWVAGHHRASFVEGMAAVAREVHASDIEIARAREEASAALVWRLLTTQSRVDESPARVVLVIDNVDDPELASDVVRQAQALPSRWLVVVTTRVKPRRPASNLAVAVEVDRLSVDAGADLLLDRIPEMDRARRLLELPHARRAAELLGYLPLALHIAGSYLGSPVVRHSVSSYVGELSGSPVRRPGLHVDEPAYHVLPGINLTLKAFGPEERDRALRLLGLLAAGAPGQPFPLGALLTPVEALTERSLRLLAVTGLVDIISYDNLPVAALHPLIARAAGHTEGMRAVLEPGTRLLDTITEAVDGGSAAYLEPSADVWPLWRLLTPHVAHVLSNPASRGNAGALRAAHRVVRQLMRRGMYRTAAELAVLAADRTAGLAEQDEALRRSAVLDRGLALQARALVSRPEPDTENDLDRAFHDINDVALATRQVCHPDDPEVMEASHRLAVILHEKGEPAEAEQLFRQVLEARERVLGRDHSDTLTTMHSLATVLQVAGRAAEAVQLLEAVLAGRVGRLGRADPATLSTRHSLAYARQAAGGRDWLQAAERDFGEVLASRNALFGPAHPNTLITSHNVAWLEQAKGHFGVAEDGFRAVLATQIRRLGKAHPHTIAVAANLAWVLLLQKEFPTSRQIFTQVLKIRATRLGVLHPDSQTTRGNLGWLTYEEGDFHRAEHRFRRLYDDRVRLLGPDHPRTLTTRHNLALSLRSQRELHRARDEFIAIRDDQERVLAQSHDSTLATKYNLAVTLRMLNSPAWLQEAMTLLDEVLGTLRGRQDPHNPLLRQTKREIVILLAIESGRADVHELVDDDDELAETPSTLIDDPLIQDFVDDDIDDFPDPDLVDYPSPAS